MSVSERAKRHRLGHGRIELDVYFLPDRFPRALRHPLETAGGPDALIRIEKAEAFLSPASVETNRWQCSLTICPPGEGHFMGIDLSISEAKKLMEGLDHVIHWEEGQKSRVPAIPKRSSAAKVRKGENKLGKAKPVALKQPKARPAEAQKKARSTQSGKGKARSAGRL